MSSSSLRIVNVLSQRRRSARLSLTPLVDVVFILLIFFMLESDFLKPHSLDLTQSPPSSGSTNPTNRTSLMLELHGDGSLWVNGQQESLLTFSKRLPSLRLPATTAVVVASDPGVVLQQVVDVLDVLTAQNLKDVSIQQAQRFD